MANVTPPKDDDWFIRNAIYCWLNYFGEEHQWHDKYTELAHNVNRIYQNQSHVQHVGGRKLMKLQNSSLSEWEYKKTTDGQVRYLLAPDLEHAAWAAAELSGGTQFLKDVKRCDEW